PCASGAAFIGAKTTGLELRRPNTSRGGVERALGWRWGHLGKGAGMASGRRKHPATKAAVAGALGVGAGILGLGQVASAAEPTQQEMLEQIKALQAKVAQL